METRCILQAGTFAGSLIHRTKDTPPVQATQCIRSLPPGGELSRPKSPRRSLRSCSARTACTKVKARTYTPHHPSAVLFAPLSPRHAQINVLPRRQSDSATSASSSTLESEASQTRKFAPRKTPGREHSKSNKNNPQLSYCESPARVSPRFRASLLLWYARLTIEGRTASVPTLTRRVGRRSPCIMDVVLDLRVQYDDDTLIELLQRRRHREPSSCTPVQTFEGNQSIDTYWAGQAAFFGDMRASVRHSEGTSPRFPDSSERSTASWAAQVDYGLQEQV